MDATIVLNKSREFLQHTNDPEAASGAIELLRDVIRFHEHRYYVMNDPLIADGEFDALFKLLEKIESLHPELIQPDSPTQRVGPGMTKQFQTVQHLVPMLSLENSYNAEDLIDWDRKARELSGLPSLEYCVEPKFDGASISLIYENDRLARGATRGDGVEGEEITLNLKQIKSLPLTAPFSAYGIKQAEIRGEVLMNKHNFIRFNEQMAEHNLPPLANPRNAASGSLRIKDATLVGKRNLEAFIYQLAFVNATDSTQLPHSHGASIDMLWDLGFRSPKHEKKILSGIQDVIDYCTAYENKRDDLPYEIDGLVIKVNAVELQEKLGMTTHHPRWAIAYKFKARQATSILLNVEFQVGRTGSITPVAKIQPVPIGGVTVTSISLHNQDFIREKDIRLGDTVLVERAGDVIPYIVKSFPELRKGSEAPIQFPTQCPACTSNLVKSEEEAVWRCVNESCPAQVIERIIHFTSKDAMDIRGLGEANIRKFNELGWLTDIPSIYTLPFDAIRSLEGFGAKSATNLEEAIRKSTTQPLHRLINALGIRYVGETTAKTIAQSIHHLLDLAEMDQEALQHMEDVGTKVAESIHHFFHQPRNIAMLKELETMGLQLTSTKKEAVQGSLSGKTFLFTGTLTELKRSEAEALAEAQGGKILSGVSSKLDFLIVGEDAGSKLEKAKKIPSIKILSEGEFLKMMR
ncbi:MAG: NAD-dependent DNA ligase LigA [Bacteroidetes bacterium]|nr:NAD-dependent DNA ligase LigA [Bacteroidota bacterium]